MPVDESPIHITPEDDLFKHELSTDCPCNPRIEDGGKYYSDIIVHNAYDARDIMEDYYSKGEIVESVIVYETNRYYF